MRICGLFLAFMLLLLHAQPPAAQLDAALIRTTVNSLAAVVHREYVDPEIAALVDGSLRQALAEGKYADLHSAEALAAALTADLFTLTRDKHLAVDLKIADKPREIRAIQSNFGIQRVEILPGNVGYLNITEFDAPDQARDGIAAAMLILRHADALIVDLRSNVGGSPNTVALFISYFFDETDLTLFQIVPKSGKGVLSYRIETAPLPGRNGRRPVCTLTSARTFSGGEGVAFLLQEMHRAEVIGETTAGAANPGRPYPLNALFNVTVPNGRLRTAVSGVNWEGTGVTPTVNTTEAQALPVAHTRLLRKLIEQAPQGPHRTALERELAAGR